MRSQNYNPKIWLYSPTNGQINGQFSSVTEQLHSAKITFFTDGLTEENEAVLLILDEACTDEKKEECILQMLQGNQRIIVLYTGKKPMPFYKVWELLGMGVEDVINFHSSISIGEIIAAKLQRWFIIDRFLNADRIKNTLIGSSPVWLKTLRQVIEIACFSSAPVLILGESGTGKELISRLIHDLDKRKDKQDLVLLDCTTIVPELSGSEFFGHEKGAYTNAVSARDGAFALADRGTLFLDEVGELPMRLQAELLRVSQEGLYKRVGSNIWKKTNFRLICATNRVLLDEVQKGNFREDLYYRITTCIVHLPPLRERKLDIPELARHFLRKALKTDSPPPFDTLITNFMMTNDYPGNVRQLEQLISRIAYRHSGNGPITIGDIPNVDRDKYTFSETDWQENGFEKAIKHAVTDGIGLKEIKRIVGEMAMDIAIKDAAGNLQEAARRLEVSDRLLQGYWAARKS